MTAPQPIKSISGAHVESALLWLVRGGLALALAAPLVVSQDAHSPYTVGKAIYSRSIIEATFAFWVALAAFYPRHRPRMSWVLVAFGAWVGASWLSGALGVNYDRSMWSTYERMQGVVDLAHWFAFALMASTAVGGRFGWRAMFSANLAVGGAVCAIGLLGHYGFIPNDAGAAEFGRLESTLGNATYLAAYAAVNALMGIGLLARSLALDRQARERRAGNNARRRANGGRDFLDRRLRPAWAVAVLLNLWALWETASRGPVAGLIVAGAVLTAFYALAGGRAPSARIARKVALAMTAALAAALMLFALVRTTSALDPIVESNRMLSRLAIVGAATDRSARERVTVFGIAVQALADKPVLGWGSDNFLNVWGRYSDYEDARIEKRFDRAHSKLLEEATGKGVLGLAAYMAIWAAMGYAAIRAFRREGGAERAFIGIVGAAMLAYFTQNLFLFDNLASTLQFSMLAAFWASEEMRAGAGAKNPKERAARKTSALANIRARILGLAMMKRARSALGLPYARTALIVAVALALVGIVALAVAMNMRIYSAAVAIRDAERHPTWSARADSYIAAADAFPELANRPRALLADDMSKWVAQASDADFERIARLVSDAGAAGAAQDPTDWLLEVSMAHFFQRAAERDRRYLETASARVERATALAPRAKETMIVQRAQDRLGKEIRQQMENPAPPPQ